MLEEVGSLGLSCRSVGMRRVVRVLWGSRRRGGKVDFLGSEDDFGHVRDL